MNPDIPEDGDVPTLAVQGLNEATRRAMRAGEVVIASGGNLLKITHEAKVEVVRPVPERKKVQTRVKKTRP